jgi:hypothetical protein
LLLVTAVATLVLGTACGVDFAGHNTPSCDTHDDISAVTLEAQAVPTATRVPCLNELPTGVGLFSARISSGHAEFVLSSDRAGARALVVKLDARCDTKGATEIHSDQAGARRFERIESVTPGFRASRYYTFPGGCITYRFQLSAEGRALVNEISLAVSSITRSHVNAEVRRFSGGRDHL